MINFDLVTDMVIKMNALKMNPMDRERRKALTKSINNFFGEESLEDVYVNELDNDFCPDVFVMPIFNTEFADYLFGDHCSNNCPFGYTVEFKKSAFSKYSPEELVALMIHHALQNCFSASAKTRFLEAYNSAMDDLTDDAAITMYHDFSSSELCYLAYIDICARTFNVPIVSYDYIGTDDVLRSVKLDDAYESAIDKMDRYLDAQQVVNMDPNFIISEETKRDFATIRAIFTADMRSEVALYYDMILNRYPLVTLKKITIPAKSGKSKSLKFYSRHKKYEPSDKCEMKKCENSGDQAISESVMNPKNEIELRFQIDKVITETKYIDTEADRQAVLYRIKQLQVKLLNTETELRNRKKKDPNNNEIEMKIRYVGQMRNELDSLRMLVVNKAVVPKRYGVFVKYPSGYEY